MFYTPANWNKNVCRQIKRLLAAYLRENMPNEPSELEDNVADCSGDELGETVSSNGELVELTADCSGDEQIIYDDETDTPRKTKPKIVVNNVSSCKVLKPKPEIVANEVLTCNNKNREQEISVKEVPRNIRMKPEPDATSNSDSDDSDDELRELIERKKRLEMEKASLSDAKLRRQAEREKLKAKLKTDVKTLEFEVAELSSRYKDLRR